MDNPYTSFKYYKFNRTALVPKKEKVYFFVVLILPILVIYAAFPIFLILKTGALSNPIWILFFTIFTSLPTLILNIKGIVRVGHQGIEIEYTPPWWISRFLKTKNTFTWEEILEIEISMPLGRFTMQESLKSEEDYLRALQGVQWLIILKNGKKIRFLPFLCANSDKILPWTFRQFYKAKRIQLDLPEHIEKLEYLYKNWPFIKEISKHNINIPPLVLSESPITEDVLPTKKLKAGFVLAIFILLSLFLSMPLTQGNHIQSTDTFIMPVCAGILLSALSIFWIKNDQPKPKKIPLICVSAFIGISTALTWWPLLAVINNLGGEDASEQRYVVHQDRLLADAIDKGTSNCHQSIELPNQQSRWAFLKEGTEVKLMTKRGLLGLCQYNDEGLRLAADIQKIR